MAGKKSKRGKGAAAKANKTNKTNKTKQTAPKVAPPVDDTDLDDDFAAFEAEAKAAAAKAASAMADDSAAAKQGAATTSSAAAASASSDADDDLDDDFAAFEAEAKAAAAKATAGMSGGASGASSSSTATSASAGSNASSGEADKADKVDKADKAATSSANGAGATTDADEDDAAKAAAIQAAAKDIAAKTEKLFAGKSGAKSQTVLVVGGGIAGITAAIEVAETGYDVILLEKGPALGGRVTKLNRYFPKMCHPNCGLEINYQRIRKTRRLKLMTMSEVVSVSGSAGNYAIKARKLPTFTDNQCTGCGECAKVVEATIPNPYNYNMDEIKAAYLPHEHAFPMRYVIDPSVIGTEDEARLKKSCPAGAIDFDQQPEEFDLNVGAIIWATGWKPYDAAKIDVYNYEHSPDIINNVEMERLANHDGPTEGKILRPSDGKPAKRVAMIQCAGSRDKNHLAYCSMICCLGSLKHAIYVREQYEDAQVDIYYIDIRAHEKMSQFYDRVRADEKINFIKSKPGHIDIDEDGRPVICGELTIDRDIYRNAYDLVVLATGMEPSMKETAPDGVTQDEYGFVIDEGGQFAAGVAGGPFDVATSNQSATAAALKAIQAVRG